MTQSGSLTLAACGDILLHDRYREEAEQGRARDVFTHLAPLLAEADLVVGNLETVLSDEGEPRPDKLCLRTHPAYAPALAAAGVHVVTLANNHCMDYGRDGLAATRRHLADAGIEALGAGEHLAEAARPLILERNGLRLGFIAACHESTKPTAVATPGTPGIAPLAEDDLLAAIEALAGAVDHLILLLHWGLEYVHYPTPEQVAFAHRAIERGVSVILGHHSHALQGIETYGGGVIAYSLANLTDADVDWQGPVKHYRDQISQVDRESVLLRLSLTRDGVRLLDPIPLWLADDGRPGPAPAGRADKILQALADYSQALREGDLTSFWSASIIASRVHGPLADWWHSGSLWDKIKGFRPGQLVSLYLLIRTYLQVKFSRAESRWLLSNPRNDERSMPAARSIADRSMAAESSQAKPDTARPGPRDP